MSNAFFYDLLTSVAERGRSMLKIKPWPKDADNRVDQLIDDCRALVEGRGEASGIALAAASSPSDSNLATAPRIRSRSGPKSSASALKNAA